jgi:S-adenosylmethionine:tRNA ribosyltransferase-isomerase
MLTSDFDFEFPERLIAYQPLPRGESRMMVVDKEPASGKAAAAPDSAPPFRFAHTRDLIDYLHPGDALVLNDTKVLRARLSGTNEARAKVEALLLAPVGGSDAALWEAMVKPGKRFRAGCRVSFPPGLAAVVAEVREDGTRVLDFGMGQDAFLEALEVTGKVPLPPYIKREASESDERSYQSVFAANPGSVAAPTASLHLNEAMLEAIRSKGVEIRKVTLHVGAGTFKPVQEARIENHPMHSERYVMTAETAEALNAVRRKGGKVWAVGTTAARVLETQAKGAGADAFVPGMGETRIFIHPGYAWKGVDGLLTNFHWPKSTLFMLVCSLLGMERAKQAYSEAFARDFRLFSYGDAMLIR